MGLNKQTAIEQLSGPNSISNQEALVKKIQGTKVKAPIKRIIPGGKQLTELTEAQLPTACYNWLRHCRHFTECVISLCKDYSQRKTKTSRVIDFDTKTRNTEWEIRGKKWLSERIAEVLTQDNIVAVVVERSGISTVVDTEASFSPKSEDWEPYIELTPFKPPTF